MFFLLMAHFNNACLKNSSKQASFQKENKKNVIHKKTESIMC
jgi:hypothetical protein